MDEWLTSEAAARELGVHRSTLARSGIAYRQDRAHSWRRYRRSDLDAFVAERMHRRAPVPAGAGLSEPHK